MPDHQTDPTAAEELAADPGQHNGEELLVGTFAQISFRLRVVAFLILGSTLAQVAVAIWLDRT